MIVATYSRNKLNVPIPFGKLRKTLAQWKRNLRTRRTLSKLDGWQLEDIGIDRTAGDIEASKSFWR